MTMMSESKKVNIKSEYKVYIHFFSEYKLFCSSSNISNNNTLCMDGDRYDDNDDVFDANSTNETFILSDGPTPDQAGWMVWQRDDGGIQTQWDLHQEE